MKPKKKNNTPAAHKPGDSTAHTQSPSATLAIYEVDVAEGLEKIVYGELLQGLGKRLNMQQKIEAQLGSGAIQFGYAGELVRMDAICADLPFGIAVGAYDGNVELYPRLLEEAARVAKPGVRFVLMTQEVRLVEGLLDDSSAWEVLDILSIALRGLHPRIFVLRRVSQLR